jgi:hypothetical protein
MIGFSKRAWVNDGLHMLGCEEVGHISEINTEIGFDYMSLLKGLGGGLASATGSGDQKGPSSQQMAEQQRLQQAEKSASTMKLALIGLGAVATAGLVAVLVGRR